MNPPSSAPAGFRARLLWRMLVRYLIAIPLMLLMFLPAGTVRWWEGWTYLGVLFGGSFAMAGWLFVRNPGLLDRRMKTKEKDPAQKWIIGLSPIYVVALLVVPGLDHRFGWSDVPAGIVVAADALVVLSFALCIAVLRVNPWTSRTVEVENGQRVIAEGPYAIVRHPWYAAAILMYGVTPLALGSWWALATTPLLALLFVARIVAEEKLLSRELPGYGAYRDAVRWRIVPGVW